MTSLPPPEKPTVDFNFYEQPGTIFYFDAILESLRHDLASEGADTTFTAPGLAHFTARFQKFQEDTLGREASEVANHDLPPRIPSSLFRIENLTTSSPLYVILLAAYSFQSDSDISDWQFDAPEEKDIYLDLVKHIRKRLAETGVYRAPCIYFDDKMAPEKKEKLVGMVESLGGEITSTAASATHVVYEDDQPMEKDKLNVLEQKNGRMLIHWQGLPNSYDSWVDEGEYANVVTVDPALQQPPWHVKSYWVQDSYTYNEWMAPADYDCPDKRLARTSQKRSIEPEDAASPAKKPKTPPPTTTTATPTTVTTTTANEESMTQAPVIAQEAKDELADPAFLLRQEEAKRKYLSVQTHEIVIPSYAAWFDISKIHDIERRSVPEFFNNRNKSKTPTIYKNYRDFMINTYRTNPLDYLTITACRRNLSGDVCAVIRVHAFLQQWGLINYQVDSESRPPTAPPNLSEQYKVVKQSLPETDQDEKDGDIHIKSEGAMSEKLTTDMETSDTKPVSFDDKEIKAQTCVICDDVCSKEQYCSTKRVDTYVCSNCYLDGKLPENHSSEDFVIQLLDKQEEASWSEEEERRLKEGLEKYVDDWNQIADHVSTRTRDQCVLHYLQLPTEDPLNLLPVAKMGLLQFLRQAAENPVMSTVAFLASTVEPQVAAAAGQVSVSNVQLKKEEESAAKDGHDDDDHDQLREIAYDYVRVKLKQFQLHATQYEALEDMAQQERRLLERERHQLQLDQAALKKQIDSIHVEIGKQSAMAAAIANRITPAQIQQQMAGNSAYMQQQQQHQHQQQPSPSQPSPHHSHQPQVLQQQLHLQQQQQYHYHMQHMQYQAQQHQQQQPPQHDGQVSPPGHDFNMM
ncbi:uncharacterized protein BYT42DRAFT_542295 [Radiomyces spectabilis]|uniref:uncharacterized protein n=1 Tax=Radiomyces spectabilis TaxID=64574 RepID=UPI00221F69C4|nr:uncharacterized protein BYT42DRAFT_542295 [Radiomyces spectabilis]KAI8394145.1 hypothetical protein BYT42DRAFT_542295 [Radiomyces spectabilis]